MDWQIDVAIEMEIITQEQATEEMQSKLEKFEKACVDNEKYANESKTDCYPKTMLESEHKDAMRRTEEYAKNTERSLQEEIKQLKWIIERRENFIERLQREIEALKCQ